MPMFNDGNEVQSAFANTGEEQLIGYVDELIVYSKDGEPVIEHEWVPNLGAS